MDTHTDSRSQSRPIEPRAMTLADLVVLVVGCALGITLLGLSDSAPIASPLEIFTHWLVAFNSLQGVCLAIALVGFVRRVRYGGPARPAQVLPSFFAMPVVASAVVELLGELDASGDGTIVWWWEYVSAIACPVLFGGFGLARKRLPGWAVLLLLNLAVLAFWSGREMYAVQFERLWDAFAQPPFAFDALALPVAVFVLGLIYGIPAANALLDWPWHGWTWVDWSGCGLAGVLSVFAIVWGSLELLDRKAPSFPRPVVLVAGISFVLSLAFCLLIAWRQRT